MTDETGRVPADEIVLPMFAASDRGDNESAWTYATQVLGAYGDADEDSLTEAQVIGMIFARTQERLFASLAHELERQPKAAADAAREALALAGRVRWQEHPAEAWAPAFRKADLQARMSIPLNEASEALLFGDMRTALLRIEEAEPVLQTIRTTLDPAAGPVDPALRTLALGLANSYFLVGSMIFMACAARRRFLTEAKTFFDRMEETTAGFGDADLPNDAARALFRAMQALSAAAKLQVDAGIAAVERRFGEGRELMVRARSAFAAVRPQLTENMGPLFLLRQVLLNADDAFEASIAALSDLAVMQQELQAAAAASDAGRDRIKEMEAFKEEVILSFARKDLNISNDVRTIVDVRQHAETFVQQSMSMPDHGIDQLLLLLSRLPPGAEVEAVKQDAEKAKAEKDLSGKLEKIAKVLAAAGKVVDAGKHLVPYGPVVVDTLKAIFAWLPDARPDRRPDTGPPATVLA